MSADAFLRAIRAAPDDDLPRLVFADYLDETGDPARAEFIRVQCELATLPDHDPRRRALEDREHDLLNEHEPEWCETEPSWAQEWDWRRGFIDEISGYGSPLANIEPQFIGYHPVTSVRWTYLGDFALPIDWIQAPWVPTVRSLSVANTWCIVDELATFLNRADPPNLTTLDFSGNVGIGNVCDLLRHNGLRDRIQSLLFGGMSRFPPEIPPGDPVDPADLCTTLDRAPLQHLACFDSGLTSDGLRTLLSAPFAATLKHLDISDNPIAPDAYRAFEQAHRSMRLKRLDVSGTPLAGISLEPLLHARSLESLTRLEMNGCGSARRNMEVLAGSPFWAQADHLRAHSGTIPASTFEPLAHSQGPPTLRLLDLADNYLRTSGVRLLCESPWVGSLTWLALSANYLDDESCRVLARSGRFTHLRTLHLAHNNTRLDRGEGEQITDAGATELANEPSLANLRLLSLSNTGVTHRGVNAVLNGLYWRLFGLGLAGNDLSPEVVRILAGSPRLARFVWLDLADNPRLRGRALLPLAESPYLSRLCELDCGGIDLADDVRTAFRERLGPRFSH
jgi:uncharacterized protein (TIGR02996 family)